MKSTYLQGQEFVLWLNICYSHKAKFCWCYYSSPMSPITWNPHFMSLAGPCRWRMTVKPVTTAIPGESGALWGWEPQLDEEARFNGQLTRRIEIVATVTPLPHGALYSRSLSTREEGRVEARLVDVMQKGEGGQWIRGEGRGKPWPCATSPSAVSGLGGNPVGCKEKGGGGNTHPLLHYPRDITLRWSSLKSSATSRQDAG
jgi:hypothetical protein